MLPNPATDAQRLHEGRSLELGRTVVERVETRFPEDPKSALVDPGLPFPTRADAGMIPGHADLFFEFEAQPKSTNPRVNEIGGAFICCWVDGFDIESARARCRQELMVDEWWLLSERRAFEADCLLPEGGDDSVSMFDQAVIDGFCCTVHSWPNERQEDDEIH